MYKICKTPKAYSRQVEFQDALLKMMRKKDLDNITIVALCDEVGTTRKTFYKYFDTVEDVLYSIVDKEIQASILLIEDDKDNMSKFFDFWRDRKELMDFLEKRKMSLILIERFYAQVFPLGKKAEEFSLEDMKHIGWIYALMSILIVWHHSGMQQPSEEMQEMIQMLRMNR